MSHNLCVYVLVGQWANCTSNTRTRTVSSTLPTRGRTPLDINQSKDVHEFHSADPKQKSNFAHVFLASSLFHIMSNIIWLILRGRIAASTLYLPLARPIVRTSFTPCSSYPVCSLVATLRPLLDHEGVHWISSDAYIYVAPFLRY